MKKSGKDIEEIRELYQTGRLIEAKEACLQLLKANPNDVSVIYLLSLLLLELGDFDDSEKYIKYVIAQDPNTPLFYLHLANIFKAKGMQSDAILILLDVTKKHPQFAPAFNKLGSIYFAQEKWTEAIASYQAAIDIKPDYLDAYYNLGLAFSKQKLNNEAIEIYQALLLLAPMHGAARFQLGCLLMQTQQYEDAISHFLLILKEHPFHVETAVNLASCFLKMGQIDQAKIYYRQALVMIPNDTQVLFNLGVISMQQGRIYDAIEYYLRLEKVNPDFFPVEQNLGAAFLTINRKDEALLHFRKALAIEPENLQVEHLVHVLSQDKPLSFSPPEYIKTLFDSYADHYDAHLMTSLHYQVPQFFYEAVKAVCPTSLTKRLDILDLGCGTGLLGPLFSPLAHSLTGVDISKKMLDMAAKKHIYDQLIEDDIISFLQGKKATYDLILAGDVLVYFGDLTSVFLAVSNALKDKGLFVFNTEISDNKNYELQQTGRFAHRRDYVIQLADKHHFTVLKDEEMVLREEHHEKMKGYLFVLQKAELVQVDSLRRMG